jgi:hypothetical protein
MGSCRHGTGHRYVVQQIAGDTDKSTVDSRPIVRIDIFKQYRDELPPFSDYWELMFKKMQMKVISRKDGSKVTHYARLFKNLFSPHREADRNTTERLHELGSIAVTAIITELLDQKKQGISICQFQNRNSHTITQQRNISSQ